LLDVEALNPEMPLFGWHPDAISWVQAIGISSDDLIRLAADLNVDGHPAALLDWDPQTLKQISTSALRLSKLLGLTGPMMKKLAELEVSLFQLREKIGIDRKAPPGALPRVSALLLVQNRLLAPGKWVSDVLDRAACFDPIHATTRDSVFVTPSEIAAFRLDHIVIIGACDAWSSEAQTGEWQHLLVQKAIEIPTALLPDGIPIHTSTGPTNWLRSAPDVFHAVHEAAELIHLN